MNEQIELKSISDDELVARLSELVQRSRRVESELVAHIGEVDKRKLFAREACSSMFVYCTDVLHLAEHEAYLRITVARAARKHPILLTMLNNGRLHLSGIAKLAPHLDKLDAESREQVLTRATHKTKREIEELVTEIAPKPDVPPSIRRLPNRRRNESRERPEAERPESPNENRTSGEEDSRSRLSRASAENASLFESANRPPRVEPLAPERYRVQFTASAELRDKLERLAALMPDSDLASILESAVTEKLERLEAKRLGKVKKPRKSLVEAGTSSGVRSITAPVRRFVWERDGGQCTFESGDGRRCSERRGLEFHHDEPYALGGDRSAYNIRLACKAHNMYMAEKDYGKRKMDRYRHSADRVREPEPAFELGLDRALVPLPQSALMSFATMHGPASLSACRGRLSVAPSALEWRDSVHVPSSGEDATSQSISN